MPFTCIFSSAPLALMTVSCTLHAEFMIQI